MGARLLGTLQLWCARFLEERVDQPRVQEARVRRAGPEQAGQLQQVCCQGQEAHGQGRLFAHLYCHGIPNELSA